MSGLWRDPDGHRQNKYLVRRRDGTVPEAPWFVLLAAKHRLGDPRCGYDAGKANLMIASRVRALLRAEATANFSRHAAPEAVQVHLDDARAALRALERHVEWLTDVLHRRQAGMAAGEWPVATVQPAERYL